MQNDEWTLAKCKNDLTVLQALCSKTIVNFVSLHKQAVDFIYSNYVLGCYIAIAAAFVIYKTARNLKNRELKDFQIFSQIWIIITFISGLFVFILRDGNYATLYEILVSIKFTSPVFFISLFVVLITLLGIAKSSRKYDVLAKIIFGISLIICTFALDSNLPYIPYYLGLNMVFFFFVTFTSAIVVTAFISWMSESPKNIYQAEKCEKVDMKYEYVFDSDN